MAFKNLQSNKIKRLKKLRSVLATMKYNSRFKDFLAALKNQITFFTPIINYCQGLKEGLENLTFFAPTNNHCHNFKKKLKILTSFISNNNYCYNLKRELEIQLVSIISSTSFICSSNISDLESSSI